MAAVAAQIPFVREMSFTYGEPQRISPSVRRVVARNPSILTLHGTNTYLVGRHTVAVIDPGPFLGEHRDALRRALHGATVSHVLVTHRHLDHCESAAALARETGAVLGAGARSPFKPLLEAGHFGEADDPSLTPDLMLQDGQRMEGPDWALEVVATPGHTSDHLCFSLPAEDLLLTGDHVMGWSTSVVIPPDGDMAAYRASLRLLQQRDDGCYLPAHGPAVAHPHHYVTALIAHRVEREMEILGALTAGKATVPDIVEAVYADVDSRLHPAAGMSVLAHLRALVAEHRVACHGEPTLDAEYRPASGSRR
jgi:glyoxylase-like metal-dependent hydrolase (beta-lactamase superfamily II)